MSEHAGHHRHLCGTAVYCSCGEFLGVVTVAFDADYDPAELACSECGKPGVVLVPTPPAPNASGGEEA